MSVLKLYTLGYVGSPLHIDKGELREVCKGIRMVAKRQNHMIFTNRKNLYGSHYAWGIIIVRRYAFGFAPLSPIEGWQKGHHEVLSFLTPKKDREARSLLLRSVAFVPSLPRLMPCV